ncbi:hypothetical protein [uncultured Sphingobacterium sp.]|uniref:hypothetical protein n=1 Tax=uncultured Sphingobacterium sp. TaxID=182688 RepID=UPI0025F79A60|nr:hypothetical protein [uncultured Sphingobacterium sp.]
MKGLLLIVVCIFLGEILSAQSSVRLNIVLNHVQNLTINPTQREVILTYNNLQNYKEGVEVTQKAHITVFSTGAYEVKVKLANEGYINLASKSNGVILPNIKVRANPEQSAADLLLYTGNLNTRGETIISSDKPAFDTVFDVIYQGPGNEEFVKYAEQNKTVTFTNDVLYSIETR